MSLRTLHRRPRHLGAPTRITRTLVLAGAYTLIACADSKEPPGPAHVHSTATIALSHATLALRTGEQATLTAQAKCGCGAATHPAITWTSTNDDVVTVSTDGVISGVSFGTASVVATGDGKYASALISVTPLGTVVGVEGGTVTSADGNLTLEIPSGAMAAPTDVAIVRVEDAAFAGDPSYVAGTGYEIRPLGLALRTRARLRLRYDPSHIPAGGAQERLRIRERDRQQNQWRDCDHLGFENQTVIADIERFGLYGIMLASGGGSGVGPAGGTVLSADGNAELVIPAGALDVTTVIELVKVDEAAFAPDPLFVPGTAYELRPTTLQLRVRARLRLRVDPAHVPSGMDPTRLRIRERDRDRDRWLDCEHLGQRLQFAEAYLYRFGLYAMFGQGASGNDGPGGPP